MTVSSELSRKTYAGDGATTSFATSPMVFFDAADLTVYVVTTATGVVVATLVLNTDYTVSGGDGSTGTLDLSAGSDPYGAPATGTTLVIVRNVAATQSSDLVNNDGSDAEVLEDALDRLTMIAQQLETVLGRSFTLADSDVSGASTTIPTPTASELLGWNSAGTALTSYSTTDLDLALTTAFTLTLLDDADADAVFQTLVTGATAITTPAAGDIMLLSDVSETPDDGRSITLGNMLKVINGLTEETSPATDDEIALYDVTGSATDKMTLANMLKVINSLTAGTELDGTNDKLLVYDNSASAVRAIPAGVPFRKNAIINGGFSIGQRGDAFTSATTPANNDDTYLLDRWALLSDGNDIVDVVREGSVVPTGGLHSLSLDVETANKKFGIIQFIEQANCKGLIGNTVTLSFKARKGGSNATVGTMRAVILAWDGTADSLTSDVVSAWNASGTNPTLVANWTAENTAADLTLTTSFQTFSVSAAIDTASAKNIAVLLYYNNADGTVGDFIYITDVQLEAGSVATDFEYRPIGEERALCERYCQVYGPYASGTAFANGQCITATDARLVMDFPLMRSAPSVSVSAAADFDVTAANGTAVAVTSLSGTSASERTVILAAAVAAGLVAGDATRIQSDSGNVAKITLDAEL